MIKLKKFELPDYEKVVDMYYEFTKEVHSSRKIGEKYFFYKAIQKWINSDADIILAVEDGEIIGLSICYKDMFDGLTEAIYQCEVAYVIPSKRNSRATYLLFNNAYEYAKELGLQVSSNGRIENGVDKMMIKHFNLKPKFTALGE